MGVKSSFAERMKGVGVLIICFLLINSFRASATHLRAGEIVVTRVGCSNQWSITIRVFTKSKDTDVLFGGDNTAILDFGDGSTPAFVPQQQNNIRYDLDPNGYIATAQWTAPNHTYSPGVYLISYKEPNRNQGVVNMDNSVNTEFYLETLITIDPFLGCDNSPQLSVPPIDRGCVGVTWFHNPGAFDSDGDSLSYELVIPFQDRNTTVANYKDPADTKFYLNYNSGNEAKNGQPSFKMDARDGTITWDAPGSRGEYNIAFNVREWRKVKGTWFMLGYVRRDMQIIIDECKDQRPDLIIPEDTCVVAGTILKADIIGTDPDGDPVKIEAFSEILNFAPAQSPAVVSPAPAFRSTQTHPDTLHFTWNTTCEHIKEQPYQVVFKITDSAPLSGTVEHLATFKTWFIRVVGPAPEWKSAQLTPQRYANLEWKDYKCQNADSMQIWRRNGKIDFEPDNCETGMPPFLGYELIDVVPIKDINNIPFDKYQDRNGGKGLARGATYCYRLVAVFPQPKGGESYVSKDTCIGPILADAPIITNVTVDKTSTSDGKITVRWRKPYDLNPATFPPPYKYNVYRGVGFAGPPGGTTVYSGTDTTFVDTGLNTQDNPYNYTVVLSDGTGTIVDTSAVASSVRLDAKAQIHQIKLDWAAFVPWSNQVQLYPRHLIYRGKEGDTESQLIKIDSVNVTAQGLTYTDHGQYQNIPLEDDQVYCYRVMTRGSYGNPKIKEPLINFSQIICSQPGDSIPPCKPDTPLALSQPDCDTYWSDPSTCGKNVFSNTINWSRGSDAACRKDVAYYNVYRSQVMGGDFALIGSVQDTVFTETDIAATEINRLARCYKISAVDHSGNEGELSDAVCFDACPYYELPNMFSPNNDNCNERFSAYSNNSRYLAESSPDGAAGNCTISERDQLKCARFVRSVIFHVYNRWGKEVYYYEGGITDNDGAGNTGNSNTEGRANSIYIDWDGRDKNGVELATAVYYYMAEVTFDVPDPRKQHKIIKGWVHLLR